jgi:hypothetical protein
MWDEIEDALRWAQQHPMVWLEEWAACVYCGQRTKAADAGPPPVPICGGCAAKRIRGEPLNPPNAD